MCLAEKLHGALAGHYKFKLRKQGDRLVDDVQDDVLIVMVMAVDNSEENAVFESTTARLAEMVTDLTKNPAKRH